MPPRHRLPLRVRVAPSSALPVCLLRTAGEQLCGVTGGRGREDSWSEGTRALSDTTKQRSLVSQLLRSAGCAMAAGGDELGLLLIALQSDASLTCSSSLELEERFSCSN
ncbi:unnamed protein product [Urochloa humidicola]